MSISYIANAMHTTSILIFYLSRGGQCDDYHSSSQNKGAPETVQKHLEQLWGDLKHDWKQNMNG